tara:strand:- start:273 stop:782 length:510 start_codon:yes stop_codon:yes gene_type:complete
MSYNIIDLGFFNSLMLPPITSLNDLFFPECQLCYQNKPCISRRLNICSTCLPESYIDNPYIHCFANEKGIKSLILKNILKDYPSTYKKLLFSDKNKINNIRIVLMYNTNIIKDFEILKDVITYIPQFVNQTRLWDDLKKYCWKDEELKSLKPSQLQFYPNYQQPFCYVR